MPAARFSVSASLAESRRSGSSNRFNPHGRQYRHGPGFHPYPLSTEVFLRSSTADADDESWDELGLFDFVLTNQRIGRHRFNRHSASMVESQRGLFNRGLEPWDPEERYSDVLEASLAYTASMGMMLYEQNELLRRRVCGFGINFSDFVTDHFLG